jgi:hypothetical protein
MKLKINVRSEQDATTHVQNISDISNSTINQANGNIINKGVSVKDVLDIVSCVVADKMTIYQQQAEFTAQ